MFGAPVSIAATNAATRRERSKELRFAIRGDDCHTPRQMRERAIAELDGDTHSGFLRRLSLERRVDHSAQIVLGPDDGLVADEERRRRCNACRASAITICF